MLCAVLGFVLLLFTANACTPPALANVSVQSNFVLSRFLGVWYEIQWLPGEPHNELTIWRDYYQSFQYENGSTVRLSVPGKARVLSNDTCFSFGPWSIVANNSAKMLVERQNPLATTALNWPYYVLKTDYDNYALVFGCITSNYSSIDPCLSPILWVFSRKVTLASEYLTMLDGIISNELCINMTRIERTPHSDKSCYSSASSSFISMNLIEKFFFSLLLTALFL